MDCLDRTNALQTLMAIEMLVDQLDAVLSRAGRTRTQASSAVGTRFIEALRACWQANGDHISHIYTGTGALSAGKSKLRDAALSTKRALQNTLHGSLITLRLPNSDSYSVIQFLVW